MARRMLIDATHPEETRVAVVNGNRLEEFDFETASKKQLKGNIYLARVTRVEPSLQAAFVEYGGNRHGFLAFSEIHPDYYRIPIADREALIADQKAHDGDGDGDDNGQGGGDGASVETVGGDLEEEPIPRRTPRMSRQYKIQEVITRRQVMLVQVTKEERGNKGAALTTYLSLAGRYCVLMPNTPRGGGISRKISNAADRKKMRSILDDLNAPDGMAVILRTAGVERTKTEIKRDLDYLLRLWESIRELTLQSMAPTIIHEEANLIKRAIRDLYSRDIDEVIVEGDEGYKTAKAFMKMLMPSHAKKVQSYKDDLMPLFHRYQVENQIEALHSPTVQLKSGGYIVINPTEALVAIDVNSGKSTRERNIEETAYRTNLEAADEVARQLRLRDLAGLIVIDFIDMEEDRHNQAVERRLKDAMKSDRARVQLGRISPFGLLELSRQRLRPSLLEAHFEVSPYCGGTGMIRTVESSSLVVLRAIVEEGTRQRSNEISVTVPTKVALYILNQKRDALAEIERRYGLTVAIEAEDSLYVPDFELERSRGPGRQDAERARPVDATRILEESDDATDEPDEQDEPDEHAASDRVQQDSDDGDQDGRSRRRRRPRRRRRGEDQDQGADQRADSGRSDADGGGTERPDASADDSSDDRGDDRGEDGRGDGRRRARSEDGAEDGDDDQGGQSRGRRRGRRGGRGRSRRRGGGDVNMEAADGREDDGRDPDIRDSDQDGNAESQARAGDGSGGDGGEKSEERDEGGRGRRRRPSRRRKSDTQAESQAEASADGQGDAQPDGQADDQAGAPTADGAEALGAAGEDKSDPGKPAEAAAESGETKPKRRRSPRRKPKAEASAEAGTEESAGDGAPADDAKAPVAKAKRGKATDAGPDDAGVQDAGAQDAGAQDAGAGDAGKRKPAKRPARPRRRSKAEDAPATDKAQAAPDAPETSDEMAEEPADTPAAASGNGADRPAAGDSPDADADADAERENQAAAEAEMVNKPPEKPKRGWWRRMIDT